jgi:hypothetical protein
LTEDGLDLIAMLHREASRPHGADQVAKILEERVDTVFVHSKKHRAPGNAICLLGLLVYISRVEKKTFDMLANEINLA